MTLLNKKSFMETKQEPFSLYNLWKGAFSLLSPDVLTEEHRLFFLSFAKHFYAPLPMTAVCFEWALERGKLPRPDVHMMIQPSTLSLATFRTFFHPSSFSPELRATMWGQVSNLFQFSMREDLWNQLRLIWISCDVAQNSPFPLPNFHITLSKEVDPERVVHDVNRALRKVVPSAESLADRERWAFGLRKYNLARGCTVKHLSWYLTREIPSTRLAFSGDHLQLILEQDLKPYKIKKKFLDLIAWLTLQKIAGMNVQFDIQRQELIAVEICVVKELSFEEEKKQWRILFELLQAKGIIPRERDFSVFESVLGGSAIVSDNMEITHQFIRRISHIKLMYRDGECIASKIYLVIMHKYTSNIDPIISFW